MGTVAPTRSMSPWDLLLGRSSDPSVRKKTKQKRQKRLDGVVVPPLWCGIVRPFPQSGHTKTIKNSESVLSLMHAEKKRDH